jgi:hypothetical protein
MDVLFILVWPFLSVLVGMFAHGRRNRNGIVWFLIAFFISPLVAFLLVAVLRTKEDAPKMVPTFAPIKAEDAQHPGTNWPAIAILAIMIIGVVVFAAYA